MNNEDHKKWAQTLLDTLTENERKRRFVRRLKRLYLESGLDAVKEFLRRLELYGKP